MIERLTPRAHSIAMTVTLIAMLVILVLLLGAHPVRAQDAPPPTPAWHAGAFADVGYLGDFNSPGNHLFRARGTTPRVDEFDLNMAAVFLRKTTTPASRWGLEVTAQGGQDSKAFGFSPTAPNLSGADWLRHFGPTDVSYLVPAGRGLTVQGGIFSSLIGYDSLFAKDNFAYTRPWGADFTPYYMLGGNVAYPFTDKFTLTGFVVNSYFHLSQPNHVPSVGGQLAFAVSPQLSIKENVLWGPHQEETSLSHWRFLSDTIVERKWKRATVAGELQLATETVAETGEQASWVSAQLPVHLLLGGPWSATLRPEVAHDPSGRYTSVEQTVYAMTSTLEYKKHFSDADGILRAEYRFDNSQGAQGGFFSGPANDLVPHQHLLIAAFILAFDHAFKVSK
jgi:Putative beta-barrel porin-2, OmpL-like. bbp2